MSNRWFSVCSRNIGLAVLLILLLGLAPAAQADSEKRFTVDVAQDGQTAAINLADPTATEPRGNSGVINGDIFRKGAIKGDEVNWHAEPVGVWRCAFQVLAPDPDDGTAVAAATYYFVWDADRPGRKSSTLIAQGINSHFPGSDPATFVVVGGTGKYKGFTGIVVEEVLGVNDSGALNLRYRFKINKGDDD